MKLSEAMLLGSVTCKMEPGNLDSCALGCAGNAVGIPSVEQIGFKPRWIAISERWPWIRDEVEPRYTYRAAIWGAFDGPVCNGRMTLEQLVDYVRSIEPDCGVCNRFACSCPKTAAVSEAEQLVTTY